MILVFDYDGTLHNSIVLYASAFRKAFQYLVKEVPDAVVRAGYPLNKQWTDAEISEWLGYTKEEMWSSFMPNLDSAVRQEAGQLIGLEMAYLSQKGGAELYPQVLETLESLKAKGHSLVFLSNCGISYMKRHRELFDLDQHFTCFMCAEEYPDHSKAEILTRYINENDLNPTDLVMIGDRRHDVEAGKKNAVKTIGCAYGYGDASELASCDLVIEQFEDILNYY